LEIEQEAARTLMRNLFEIMGDDDDEELVHDTIEGETNLIETIQLGLARLAELEAFENALKERMDALIARKNRFHNQRELIRIAIQHAMEIIHVHKLELPEATVSVRALPARVMVLDENEIPEQFLVPQPPKVDKRKLLDFLKNGNTVTGAELSNGGNTLSVRRS
jgi:hypothetical protein